MGNDSTTAIEECAHRYVKADLAQAKLFCVACGSERGKVSVTTTGTVHQVNAIEELINEETREVANGK